MDAFTSDIDWRRMVAYNSTLATITKQDIMLFAKKYLNNNYVAVYKKKGEDKSIKKVEKPAITPVEVNRDAQSAFLKQVNEMPETPVAPMWIDYGKDINRDRINGLTLLSVENKTNDIFRLSYRLEMGSYHNKLLPIAAEYLQYIGTSTKSAEDISKAFYQIASSFDVNVSSEVSSISLDGLQENFGQAVQLLEDLLKNCQPDEQAWQRLKSRLKKAREDAKLDKSAILKGLVSYAQYGAKNPFNYVLTDEELEAVQASELTDILHDLINYEHQVIYYGPKSTASLSSELSALHVTASPLKAYPAPVKFEKTTQNESKVYFAHYDMVQAEIDWFRNSDVYDPDKTAVIQLFNNYFGGGMSGIVFQTIRESKALAYSTYAVYSSPSKKDDRYSILAYVGTQADKLKEAISGMNELLHDLPASEKVFNTSKEGLLRSLETSRITEDGIIYSFLNARRLGVDYDMRKKVYNEVKDMNFSDLQYFHRSEFKGKAYSYCIVGSRERVKNTDLAAYGTVQELDLKTLFGY
jgi:predicted Zn-dependent peptidase